MPIKILIIIGILIIAIGAVTGLGYMVYLSLVIGAPFKVALWQGFIIWSIGMIVGSILAISGALIEDY